MNDLFKYLFYPVLQLVPSNVNIGILAEIILSFLKTQTFHLRAVILVTYFTILIYYWTTVNTKYLEKD